MKNKNKNLITTNSLKTKRRSSGFALIEVLLSALVLAIGSAAFLKLQSLSLKNSHDNYSRTQATVIASGFVDRLRSNRSFLGAAVIRQDSIVGGMGTLVSAPQSSTDCQPGGNDLVCAESTFGYQKYLTGLQMQASFPSRLSLLCFIEDNRAVPINGYFRVTVFWRNNKSDNKNEFSAADCPNSFNDTVSTDSINNSVTIYAQI